METFFRLLARKTGRLFLTVFVISTVVFFILRVIPGDPAYVVAGVDAPSEAVEAIRARLGTGRPVLVQYGEWLSGILRFDFGSSLLSEEKVSTLILSRFPLTLLLALAGMGIAYMLALPLGILSAVKRWSFWDYAGMIFSQIGMAVPSFWLAILLLFVFSVWLRIFPLFGGDTPVHLVLPVLAMGINRAAVLVRMVRTSMSVELGREYIITAVSKGLPDKVIRYRHALRNALLPLITFSGIQFGYMLGGSIIIEQVFSLPGLGRLILSAIYQRDFPVIQGGVIFVTVVFCFVNFLVDVLYSYINPRIRVS
ncbi:MAG: ABC transporter permease [Spirochaetales bacterium]|jgi:peptide/nickel transport system permease protein|nr:ABC transporter permease [Spirochaetales bacterium]